MSKYSVTTLVAVLVLAGAAVPARADMLSATGPSSRSWPTSFIPAKLWAI